MQAAEMVAISAACRRRVCCKLQAGPSFLPLCYSHIRLMLLTPNAPSVGIMQRYPNKILDECIPTKKKPECVRSRPILCCHIMLNSGEFRCAQLCVSRAGQRYLKPEQYMTQHEAWARLKVCVCPRFWFTRIQGNACSVATLHHTTSAQLDGTRTRGPCSFSRRVSSVTEHAALRQHDLKKTHECIKQGGETCRVICMWL